MMTVTSIGYGDISPASLIEYGISILCQFIGAVTWAACVSQLAGIFANLNPHDTAWKQVKAAIYVPTTALHVSWSPSSPSPPSL